MEDILVDAFLKILNMSMTASYIILAVIIARLLLRRAPKKYSYALWAVALFRLVCPVSFKSVISIFALKPFDIHLEDTALSSRTAEIVHIPENIGMMAQPEIQTGLPAVNAVVNESLPAATPMYSANPMQIWEYIGMLLWVTGIVILLTVSLISLWRLCRRLRTATLLEGNVWQSEKVQSPFIIGLFRPKIYIPYGLEGAPLGHVLAHERAHIKRGDHVVRTLAYLVLCIHWFNPLVWIAFWLMGRDMELSCDEKVLSSMGDKAEYSETLLSFAAPRRFPTPTPLAFGESSVGRRIKNALKWKRPRLWVSIIALVLCAVVIAACAANPKTEDDGWELSGRWVPIEQVYTDGLSSDFFYGGDNGLVYEFYGEDGENREVRVYEHRRNAFLGGYSVGEWQDFPYSEEEWEEMFVFSQPVSMNYDEILYLGPGPDLNRLPFEELGELESFMKNNGFFLKVDGELWYVNTVVESTGRRRVSGIYALQKEDELGKASFVYPDGTSNEPGMEIEFSDGVESVYAFCDEGSVGMYVQGELFSWGDGSITVPGLDSLFWCPVQMGADYQRPQPYGLAENDRILLVVHFNDLSSISCSIYVDCSDGTYTLRPVGKGVYLSQTGEGKALLSFDRSYAHPDSTATDIPAELPAGSPWELLTGLDYGDVSSVMLDRAAAEAENDLNDVARQVIEALDKVSADELCVGRGAPNQYYLSLGFNEGKSGIRLGFCGDFVEMQLEGEFKELYPAEGGPVWEIHNDELTALMEGFMKSAAESDILSGIYEFTSQLYGKDVEVIGINPTELSERLPNDINRRVADALRGVKASEIGIGSVFFEVELALDTPEGNLSLLYDGEKAMLDFDGILEEKYSGILGSWVIDSPEIRALFDSILPNEDDYQIISGNIRQLKKAWIEREGVEVVLSNENTDALMNLLAAGEKRVELYPSHIGSMQDSTYCTLVLEYKGGKRDEIILGSESGCFFRFTGTYGWGNDRGFVQLFSDEARALVKSLLGE